jgi:hypothetical protein
MISICRIFNLKMTNYHQGLLPAQKTAIFLLALEFTNLLHVAHSVIKEIFY